MAKDEAGLTKEEAAKEAHAYDVDLNALSNEKRLVVFGEDFVADAPVGLHMKSKWSWRGDDMSVTDQAGETWFQVKGDSWKLAGQKVVCGKDGAPLFVIADKKWYHPITMTQLVYDCRGYDDAKEARDVTKDESKLLFSVTSNFANTKQEVTVNNLRGGEVSVVGKCHWFSQKGAMWRDGDHKTGGIPLAKFMSPLEFQNFFGKGLTAPMTQDFHYTVVPGADIAFCTAFVIALREMESSRWH